MDSTTSLDERMISRLASRLSYGTVGWLCRPNPAVPERIRGNWGRSLEEPGGACTWRGGEGVSMAIGQGRKCAGRV
jgi:hypothetical protein